MCTSISWASKRARESGVARSIGGGSEGAVVLRTRVEAWAWGEKVGERRAGRSRCVLVIPRDEMMVSDMMWLLFLPVGLRGFDGGKFVSAP